MNIDEHFFCYQHILYFMIGSNFLTAANKNIC